MCVNCLTSAEAIVINSAAIIGAGSQVVQRLRDRAVGIGRTDRARATYDANAAFLRSLGHDPLAVLGPRPGWTDDLAGRPERVRPEFVS